MGEVKIRIDALADAKRQIEAGLSLVGELESDLSNLETMCALGDRFNGLIGTFSFGEGNEIYDELVDISRMIDNLTAIYKKDELSSVRQEHFDFIKMAANLCSKLLEDYVTIGNVEGVRQDKKVLVEHYNNLGEVDEREVLDQDSIDNLLDDLL